MLKGDWKKKDNFIYISERRLIECIAEIKTIKSLVTGSKKESLVAHLEIQALRKSTSSNVSFIFIFKLIFVQKSKNRF
jgi:hypothetical protein